MNISIILFCRCLLLFNVILNNNKIEPPRYSQAMEIAIQDFSKTKLFIKDSVFIVSLSDTLHRMALKKIKDRNYAWVDGNSYPGIIAVDIGANSLKFLLDTTASIDTQNKTIPSRVFEKDGKLFVWYDKNFPLTDGTIRTLNKFDLIKRGIESEWYKLYHGSNDSKKSAHYYFCRSNLSNYKRIITNMAIEYYDPPNISCK